MTIELLLGSLVMGLLLGFVIGHQMGMKDGWAQAKRSKRAEREDG